MYNSFFKKRYILFLGLAVICLSGFSNSELGSIETAILNQDYKEAKALSERILAGHPSDSIFYQAQYYLGLSHLRLGEYESAKSILNQLISKVTDSTLQNKAYLGLIDIYYLEGHYQKAYDITQEFLTLSPQSDFLSLIYLRFAKVNLKMANWRQARKYLKKIVRNFPDSLEVHIARELLKEKRYFAVQVGAFVDRQHAEELVHELKQKGEYAYVVETTDQQNRRLYRVRVGQLALLDEAQELKTELSKQGYPTEIYP